jgi:hypothetical protein
MSRPSEPLLQEAGKRPFPGRRVLLSVWTWFAVAAACAAVWAFDRRFEVTPDGLFYIDLASAAVKHGAGSLINANWCPAYPGFLAIWLWLLRPSPATEAPVVHFAGWLTFCGAAAAFALFLGAWMKLDLWNREKHGLSPAIESFFCYSAFLWIFRTPEFSTTFPDAMLSAFLFLAAWCCVKATAGGSRRFYVLLGLMLAACYYTKPAGFIIALILLAILLAWPPAPASRRKVILAALVFGAASLPLVIAISKRAGEFTDSESGKLNYLWEVNGFYPLLGWTGQNSAEHGTPLHPPRVLFDNPRVLEFATPVGGTYPLWYDPAYWYAGARIRFEFRQQIAAVWHSLRRYYAAMDYWPFWIGAIILGILGGARSLRGSLPSPVRWILVWPLCTFAVFSAVYLEPRYMAPFAALVAAGVFSPLASRAGRVANGVLLTVSVAMILSIASVTGHSASNIARQEVSHYRSDDQKIADSLSMLGLRPGDTVATVGFTFDAYWAHIAKLRIVAQALDKNEFWKTDESHMDELMTRLRSLGVKAVVARAGGEDRRPGWTDLPPRVGEQFRAFLLP